MDRIPLTLYPMGGNAPKADKLESLWTSSEYVAEAKFDGERYLLIHDFDGSVRLTSRTKSKKTGLPVNKIDNTPHFVEMARKMPKGSCIDGEVITHIKCTSSDVSKFMGCKQDEAIKRQKEHGFVNFVAYDILYFDGITLLHKPWTERRKTLEHCVENYIGLETKHIDISSYFECDKIDVKAWYESLLQDEREGIMIKAKHATYKPGTDKMEKPAGVWYKVKCSATFDCIVTNFLPPEIYYTGKEISKENGTWKYWINEKTGELIEREASVSKVPSHVKPVTRYYFNNWIGSVEFSQYDDNGKLVVVGSCSGMNDETREMLTNNKDDLIGHVCVVNGMEWIEKSNSIRHPVFAYLREDKLAEECKLGG